MNDLDISKIREALATKQGKAFWQSLDELADTAEFRELLEREFPQQAIPLEGALDRRSFLKLLGASLALGGLTACVRPVRPQEKIIPYVRAPEEIIPGKPLFFATAVTQGGYALGLLAESHQGRPTKVEGNPDHPASLGATDASSQATVLGLYDPDRSQALLRSGAEANWSEFVTAMQNVLGSDGSGVRILSETVTSPTLSAQIDSLTGQYPALQWHQYDVLHDDNALAGGQLAFGRAVQPVYDFGQADVIVSLGGDFLGRGPAKLAYSKAFARRRRVLTAEDDMNRLYVVESSPSPTGAVADHRLPLKPSAIAALARALAQALGVGGVEGALPEGADSAVLEAMVADLQASAGSSIVITGPEQPPEVHALTHAINAQLGNVGQTVRYLESPEANPTSHIESLRALVEEMRAGEVRALIILGGNPAYTAPADLDFAGALANVPLSAHLSLYLDETSSLTTWHIPETHYLETWSDARAFDGTTTIMQPLIAPFYGGKSAHEVLAALAGDGQATGYDLLRSYWQSRVQGDFDAFWREAVYRGVVAGSAAAELDVAPDLSALGVPTEAPGGLELLLQPDPGVLDGRYANNGWLQELPKPLSKITWDNAAYLGASTAEALGVTTHDRLSLRVEGREVIAPVWVLPGVAKDVVAVQLGYGRRTAGRVGSGVGFSAYALMTSAAPRGSSVTASKVAGRYKLASTQLYFQYDGTTERRHLVRNGTLAEFRAEPERPEFAHPVELPESDLYPNFAYQSYQWGMVIDQTVCTGCNACITACYAENNIPIVGKDQVEVGRHMQWIRIDTYFGGDLDNPDYYLQPIVCMHCEKAPCEPVCPVGATVHDNEGLNVMIYNRCVGTRYCSNNCPYKVRRFNFLQYAELSTNASELALAYNPDVTVRSRGVMEKCTYCIQRIQEAYITSENEGRRIADGEVITACQAACPTEAIVFGDIGDPESAVTRVKASPLNYGLLSELNTVPRTSYLARVSNPNPSLEEGVS